MFSVDLSLRISFRIPPEPRIMFIAFGDLYHELKYYCRILPVAESINKPDQTTISQNKTKQKNASNQLNVNSEVIKTNYFFFVIRYKLYLSDFMISWFGSYCRLSTVVVAIIIIIEESTQQLHYLFSFHVFVYIFFFIILIVCVILGA